MKKKNEKEEPGHSPKKDYDFGTFDVIVIDVNEEPFFVFGLHGCPSVGGDGCDPNPAVRCPP